ncbi:hypothetical protein GQ54DRAFT_300665 [Martensiomyces pterosporus]|nr:hypothetical protein GQ54DRAFT_300665 [Martensiomyces pterosporus]
MHSTELDAAPANPLAAEQMAPNVGGKTPRQVAEEYLARPFDVEKEPIKQIMMVEQLIGFVSDWAVDKINQLLWFIPRAWVDEIMRDPDAADSFSNTAKRVKAIAKRHEKLQALYRRKDDKGRSAESKEELSRKSTVSSVPRVAEPSKDHSRDREIDDLRDKLARLTLKFEAMSKERETVRFTCYYCAEEGHRTGSCAALREDMAKGLVQEIAGRYCFLPGEQLPRSSSK